MLVRPCTESRFATLGSSPHPTSGILPTTRMTASIFTTCTEVCFWPLPRQTSFAFVHSMGRPAFSMINAHWLCKPGLHTPGSRRPNQSAQLVFTLTRCRHSRSWRERFIGFIDGGINQARKRFCTVNSAILCKRLRFRYVSPSMLS